MWSLFTRVTPGVSIARSARLSRSRKNSAPWLFSTRPVPSGVQLGASNSSSDSNTTSAASPSTSAVMIWVV
jgi:hypothetical protein